MSEGWIKVHRSMLNKGWFMKPDYLSVWMYLLMSATHSEYEYLWNGTTIILKPGQFITTRKKIAVNCNVITSKVHRILKFFENEHQIEQQTTNTSRLISIINWEKYQVGEHHNEQRVNNERTTSEQRVNTKQEGKEKKELNNDKKGGRFTPPSHGQVLEYLEVKYCDHLTRDQILKTADRFINYYESVGWVVGKNKKMKSWQHSLNNFANDEKGKQSDDKIGRNTKADIREAMRTDNF